MRSICVLLVALVSLSTITFGRDYCPRITSQHNADTTDLHRFRQFAAWKDKQGGDLAYAIWQYLSSYETGIYHFNEVTEGPDPFVEFATMREPLKMLNVYNMGYCGIFGPTFEGILYGVDDAFHTGRSFAVKDWSHCATEIFYDNSWHYFDIDIRGVLLKPDGTVASLEDARTQQDLWVNPQRKSEPHFPNVSGQKAWDIYRKTGIEYQYRWFQGSHTADFVLRPGESLTRWWQPQGHRWNHRPSYTAEKWARDLLLTEPVGMKPNHRDFTPWNHGNGLFEYQPDLTAASRDFAEGVVSSQGLKPGKDGLVLTEASGEAVFSVFTPFVIVPTINDIDNGDKDTEASVVTLDLAVPTKVSVSVDNGMTWQEAASLPAGAASVDLTKWVKGTYGYQLKLAATGAKDALAVSKLAIATWVQVGAISLPRLKQGSNELRYDCSDRYDGITEPMLVLPNVFDPADLKKYATFMPTKYTPNDPHGRVQGDLVIRLQAPEGRKIAWLSAGATFSVQQEQEAPKTANSISYAVGKPEIFTTVYDAQKEKVPTWTDHWRSNWDLDIRLDQPAEVVYVRYHGDPAVDVVRACLHLTPSTQQDPAVRVTYGYKLDGKMTEKTVEMAKPGAYSIDCPGVVENVFIKMAKPSK